MSRKNFITAIPLEFWVRVIGVLLLVLYICLLAFTYWRVGPFNITFFLFFVSLLSSIGVLCRKEAARRSLITVNGIGLFYILLQSFLSKSIDNFSVLFAFFFLSIIVFYRLPVVRIGFMPLPGSSPAHFRNILLIDDDKMLAKMMTRSFLQKGIILSTAHTGERGLSMAQRQKLDLIILDVILPGIKGREVCQRLKEDSRTKDIPIVFLTVKDSQDDMQAEREAGAVSHLTKPVDFPTLYKEIKKILGE